jgi:hypothetical protein
LKKIVLGNMNQYLEGVDSLCFRISELLQQESPENLKYNLRLAPIKVSDFVVKNFTKPAL